MTVTLTRRTRARGVLLTPHGAGPFPAVLLLHDHGSRFDIGKEKCVRPWYDDTRLASAEEWAARHFDGRFPGDELARRGHVVLCVDALGWGERGPLVYEEQQALAAALYQLGSSSPDCTPARTSAPPPSSPAWTGSTRAGSPQPAGPWAATAPGRPPR